MDNSCSAGGGQAEAMNVGHYLQVRQMSRLAFVGTVRHAASFFLPLLSVRTHRP